MLIRVHCRFPSGCREAADDDHVSKVCLIDVALDTGRTILESPKALLWPVWRCSLSPPRVFKQLLSDVGCQGWQVKLFLFTPERGTDDTMHQTLSALLRKGWETWLLGLSFQFTNCSRSREPSRRASTVTLLFSDHRLMWRSFNI
jgi:hypothetical protein